MKLVRLTILCLAIVALFGVSSTWAQIADPMINFTGKVTELDGSPVADGNYDFVFSLYDEKTGGTALWTETLNAASRFSATISGVNSVTDGIEYTFTGDNASSTLRLGQYLTNSTATGSVLITDFNLASSTVTVASGSPEWTIGDSINNLPYVDGGIINENLSSVTSLAGVDFGKQLYLEIIFNGETMQPRKVLTSVAHAISATQLSGKNESQLATLAENEIVTGEWTFNNIVDIATSSASTALTITQNGSGNILEVKRGTTTSLAVLADGRVQIGEYVFPTQDGIPGYVLKTNGFGSLFWSTDFAGSGGGSGLWASSTNNQYITQSDKGNLVVLGDIATSSMGTFKLYVNGDTLMDNLSMRNQSYLRFYDSDNTNYMDVRASGTIANNFTLTFPDNPGQAGRALVTDGNGNLDWANISSGSIIYDGVAGYFPFYQNAGTNLTATSSIYIDTSGNIGIGTTSPASQFTVGGIQGNQFQVNSVGEIVMGTWQGDVLDVAYGGTGTSTFEANSVLFADAQNDIGEILAGADGAVLKMIGGVPTWGIDLTVGGESTLWATSSNNLAIMPTNINNVVLIGRMSTTTANSVLEVEGNAYFTANIDAASMTLANALAVTSGGTGSSTPFGILVGDGAGNIVSLHNNSTLWNTTSNIVTASSTGWETASAGFATNGANWNTAYGWGNHATQGYFSTTTDQILDVAYGGTGTTTWSINSLVFANANNSLSQILPGSNGYALVMQGGVPTWASTSPGTSHDLLSALHSDTEAGLVQRGDLIVGSSTSGIKWARLGLGPNGYILRSDGLDTYWASTTGITEVGTINIGKWEGDVIGVAFGGTGTTTWTTGSIVIASGTNELGELTIGNNGYILQSVNGSPSWVSTSSLNIDASAIGGTLASNKGGTGKDSSGWNGMVHVVGGVWSAVQGGVNQVAYWSDANTLVGENQLDVSRGGTGADMTGKTGFLYFDGGVASASNTISISRTDLADNGTGVVLTNNILSLDASGDWTGTFDGEEGSYYLNAVNLSNFITPFSNALAATTTDAIGEGFNHLYWTNARFDSRFISSLVATTSLNSITELSSLTSVGTITAGTWQGDILDVAYGGTGTSTFEANSLLFADAQNDIGEILAGANGAVLKMVGGVPTWGIDLTVGGESTLWATSSDNLLIHPSDIAKVVVVGGVATSSAGYSFEVAGGGDALFTGNINAQSLTLLSALAVGQGGTGSTTPSGIMVGDGAGNIVSLPNNSGAWNSTAATFSSNSAGWDSASAAYAANGSNWNTAFAWGNHATQGYFSTTTDGALDIAYGGTGTSTWQAGSLVYADVQNSLNELLAGLEGQVLVIKNGKPYWSATSSGAAHSLLGVDHNDVIAAAVQRGDLIIGTSTPTTAWARLALGPDGYILRSDGTDLTWSTTTKITALGTVLVGRWEADVIDIAHGGTGANTATGARENLGLAEVHKFGINATGSAGYVWQSDGAGRGEWVATSTLGIREGGSISKFVGTTTTKYYPAFATSTFIGYQAANEICSADYPGSHFCRTYDMIVTIEQDDISDWSGSTWIAEGPPGFTANANDCNGWTSSSSAMFGPFWAMDSDGGGMAWLTSCETKKTLACCTWQ